MAAQPNQLLHYLLALDQTRAAMRNPNGATPPFVDPQQQQQQPGQPQPTQQPSNIVNGYRQMGNNYYQLGKGIAGLFKHHGQQGGATSADDPTPPPGYSNPTETRLPSGLIRRGPYTPNPSDDTQSLDNNPQGEAVYGEGGIAFGPTHALVGDDNEPEYIVPESKVDDFAAETAATGKPPDPSKIPGKDEQNFTPIPQSMRPPMLAAPGQAPQTPPPPPPTPQQAGPPAMGAPGQLPPVPSMAPAKKPGIGARILGGISGFYGGAVDASGRPVAGIGGAIQGAEDPGRKQRMAEYGMQTQHAKTQAELGKTQAETAEAGQRGKYYEAQAQSVQEEGKLRPIALKDGSLYDPKTHQIINNPKTIRERMQDYLDAGFDEGTARLLAAGVKPAEANAPLEIDPASLPENIRGLIKPGPNGKTMVSPSVLDTIIKGQTPKTTAPDQQILDTAVRAVAQQRGIKLDPSRPLMEQLPVDAQQQAAHVHRQLQQNPQSDLDVALKQALLAQRTTGAENKQDLASKQQAIKTYTPVMDSAERFNVMSKNYEDAVKNHDQQAMLSLLANHLGMTMGLQKGARLNQAIIKEAEQSRPWLQGLQAKFDKSGYLTGVVLTPEQMRQMVNLGRERFSEDYSKARNEAQFLGINEGPQRTPSRSTMNHYIALASGDAARAKQLAAQDGWSVQ